jgi:hypothetical protein
MNGLCSLLLHCYCAMIHYLLHLHKTHVSNNKKQEQWKEMEKIQEKELCYTMLYYAILYAIEIKQN